MKPPPPGPPPKAVGPPPPPILAKPPVHMLLVVDVIRTESAVTEPLLAAGPTATTQSPTATSVDVADCVVATVVLPDVVNLRLWVFGGVNVFVFFDPLDLDRGKLPGEIVIPETDSVDPFTAVTFPDATAKSARRLPKALPGFFGGLPVPPRTAKPSPEPEPVRNRKPPAGAGPRPPLN